MKVKEKKRKKKNLMHPNTNSSNWLVKSFSCCLYISEGCKNQRKAIYLAPSAIACQHVWWQGRVYKAVLGRERAMVKLSSAMCPQMQSPMGTGLCSALFSVLGHVPPAPATRGCETFTGLIQSWHLCHAERYLRRKRPLLVCQTVYSPHCTQSLFTVVPQGVNQRERGTKTF